MKNKNFEINTHSQNYYDILNTFIRNKYMIIYDYKYLGTILFIYSSHKILTKLKKKTLMTKKHI